MRLTAIAIVVTLLAVVPASGQTPEPAPCRAAQEHPYGLDPYNPSDAALLREYGVTLVAQTPLVELRKLDPYKPSHAALLRQLGGGIPLWGWAWYASPGPAPLTPFSPVALMSSPTATTRDLVTETGTRARRWVTPGARRCRPTSTDVDRDVAQAGKQRRRLDTLRPADSGSAPGRRFRSRSRRFSGSASTGRFRCSGGHAQVEK